MTNRYYHKWLITYKDTEPPETSYSHVNDGEHYMHIMLQRIYEQIDDKQKTSLTQIPEDRILLTQSDSGIEDYTFSCYFEAKGGQGFGRNFFQQQEKSLAAGAKGI